MAASLPKFDEIVQKIGEVKRYYVKNNLPNQMLWMNHRRVFILGLQLESRPISLDTG